jgi:hypothetical protein
MSFRSILLTNQLGKPVPNKGGIYHKDTLTAQLVSLRMSISEENISMASQSDTMAQI